MPLVSALSGSTDFELSRDSDGQCPLFVRARAKMSAADRDEPVLAAHRDKHSVRQLNDIDEQRSH